MLEIGKQWDSLQAVPDFRLPSRLEQQRQAIWSHKVWGWPSVCYLVCKPIIDRDKDLVLWFVSKSQGQPFFLDLKAQDKNHEKHCSNYFIPKDKMGKLIAQFNINEFFDLKLSRPHSFLWGWKASRHRFQLSQYTRFLSLTVDLNQFLEVHKSKFLWGLSG